MAKYIYYPTTNALTHVPTIYFSNQEAAQKFCDEMNIKYRTTMWHVQKDYIFKNW